VTHLFSTAKPVGASNVQVPPWARGPVVLLVAYVSHGVARVLAHPFPTFFIYFWGGGFSPPSLCLHPPLSHLRIPGRAYLVATVLTTVFATRSAMLKLFPPKRNLPFSPTSHPSPSLLWAALFRIPLLGRRQGPLEGTGTSSRGDRIVIFDRGEIQTRCMVTQICIWATNVRQHCTSGLAFSGGETRRGQGSHLTLPLSSKIMIESEGRASPPSSTSELRNPTERTRGGWGGVFWGGGGFCGGVGGLFFWVWVWGVGGVLGGVFWGGGGGGGGPPGLVWGGGGGFLGWGGWVLFLGGGLGGGVCGGLGGGFFLLSLNPPPLSGSAPFRSPPFDVTPPLV